MGLLRSCNNCGHEQMIGHNPVDGRVKWWTSCEACGQGNFMAHRPLPLALRRKLAALDKQSTTARSPEA